MSYSGVTRPSLDKIRDDIINNVTTNLVDAGVNVKLRYSTINVVSNVLAGAVHEMYSFAEYMANQTNLLYCDRETLDAFGQIYNLDPVGSLKAKANITIIGKTGAPTVTLKRGTQFTDANGNTHKLMADYTVETNIGAGGLISRIVNVVADQVGTSQNFSTASPFTFVTPITNIPATNFGVTYEKGTLTNNGWQATANITVFSTYNGVNTLLPAGTTFVDSQGNVYLTERIFALNDGTSQPVGTRTQAAIEATATLPGTKFNHTSEFFSFAYPQASNIDTVNKGYAFGGVDPESTEAYRKRILDYIANDIRGGSEEDFIFWAKSTPIVNSQSGNQQVTRAWVESGYNAQGLGTVDVRCVIDDQFHLNGQLSTDEINQVQIYMDDHQPIGCNVRVLNATASQLNITIANLKPAVTTVTLPALIAAAQTGTLPTSTQDQVDAAKKAIESNLADLFLNSYGCGDTVRVSDIWRTIGESDGVASFNLTAPLGDIAYSPAQLPVLGTITYV